MKPDKINYSHYGNWVPHPHRHIIPGFKEDEDFGNPPTIPRKNGGFERKELTEKEVELLKRELKLLDS